MTRIRTTVLAVAACLAASGLASAHHSFVGTYDEKAPPVTIKGEIVQFLFRNPHSFIHVLAPDDKGEMQRWAIEWGGGGQIQRMGITRETLKPGDVVIITGVPGRQPADHRILIRKIERPIDGWNWSGTVE
jgi:hypothetical protein